MCKVKVGVIGLRVKGGSEQRAKRAVSGETIVPGTVSGLNREIRFVFYRLISPLVLEGRAQLVVILLVDKIRRNG